MKRFMTMCLILLFVFCAPVDAEELTMVRVGLPFPEAMMQLQYALNGYGYTCSRVQPIDEGLSHMGYKTDKYRVLFFGKEEQIRRIIEQYPALTSYLPLKVLIYSEGQDTLIISPNLEVLLSPQDPELKRIVQGWQHDIQSVLAQLRES